MGDCRIDLPKIIQVDMSLDKMDISNRIRLNSHYACLMLYRS